MEETAGLYGVSTDTLYRALRERAVPKSLRRCDHGVPRVMGLKEMHETLFHFHKPETEREAKGQ